jgi:DNA invertase Pin-like site-specific DNA recombinase
MSSKEVKTIRAYIRISTDQQDAEVQQHELTQWLAAQAPHALVTYTDTASGAVDWRQRKIAEALRASQPGDVIVVSEVSRLARTTIGCLEIFGEAAAAGVTVVALKNGLTMDGSQSARIVGTVLAMAAEIERDMIRARTQEALARRAARGLPIGRPTGARSASKLTSKRTDIERLHGAGVSIAALARLYGVARNTMGAAIKQFREGTQ